MKPKKEGKNTEIEKSASDLRSSQKKQRGRQDRIFDDHEKTFDYIEQDYGTPEDEKSFYP